MSGVPEEAAGPGPADHRVGTLDADVAEAELAGDGLERERGEGEGVWQAVRAGGVEAGAEEGANDAAEDQPGRGRGWRTSARR